MGKESKKQRKKTGERRKEEEKEDRFEKAPSQPFAAAQQEGKEGETGGETKDLNLRTRALERHGLMRGGKLDCYCYCHPCPANDTATVTATDAVTFFLVLQVRTFHGFPLRWIQLGSAHLRRPMREYTSS